MYLATNPSGQKYISTSTLNTCKTYSTKKRICTDFVVYDGAARPICELQILFSVSSTLPETCTTSTFAAKINTFQNIENNKWLYILSENTPAVLQCHSKITHQKLQGAGILTLPEGCKLHTGYSTLAAYHTSEINITYPIIMPDIRNEDCFKEIKRVETPQIIPIAINNIPLDSLKQIKNHLDQHSEHLNKFKEDSMILKQASRFSWMNLAIGTLLLIIIVLRCCWRCRCPSFFRRPALQQNENQHGVVQIFNNCFRRTRRRNTHISIPMTTIHGATTTCISEDEDDDIVAGPTKPLEKLGANTQSLF